jgi:hypothetical protein
MTGSRLALAALTFAIVAVVACDGAGVSRERAVAIAVSAGADSTTTPTVVWAELGPLARFTDAALVAQAGDRQVWAVLLQGSFEGECVVRQDGSHSCPPLRSNKLILLDAASGEFILGAIE